MNQIKPNRPLVAIVGRPNVGKSALFNRLVGRRVAIVEDTPGITRDRLYQPAQWRGHHFTVIDTGGILFSDQDPLTVQVRAQAQIAMEEAALILFVVDAASGLTPTDQEIADTLRASLRPVLLVVNKTDNTRLEQHAAEFYALGFAEIYPVSAIHGHGVADLLDRVIALLQQEKALVPSDLKEEEESIRLAIVGRPNVGKSSLLNAILGEERAIVSPMPGTTRDALDTHFTWSEQPLTLIDTAGIRRSGKVQGTVEYYMVLRARTAMERSDVALVVVDAEAGITDGDKRVAQLAQEAGRACVIVVNKWDLVDPQILNSKGKLSAASRSRILKFTEQFRRECSFLDYAPLAFVSAKERFGVTSAIETAIEAAQNHAHRIATGELNRLIHEAISKHPLLDKGRAFKVYYATMVGVRPPTIVLFCNEPEMFHFSYRNYLENQLRAVYPLEGTPIRFLTRKAENRPKV
ncbi:ribosome-associated GTPase EngA [Chthonomonas calidirosea]|uniref:GTPase Der n=1 Tax=Chthonomonas calidirosea (strain DSM 23976 / ICMP 18418 / T49) TaxID=1303518 RepID=S0EU76_CHTCT|nr:ribosome biogenesis GTPase Der [Chthonomonas calidirosea]CCW34829.1 ribosome-associated GTPase EngA [Chthonomonas calidirosea T49]CEK13676.1 ribosome-associated GTPase EngA [Chthonomonas calidirosea]